MTDKLKQNKFRVGDIIPHVLNFVVVFTTFVYEFSMIVDGFLIKELTVTVSSFVLYIGTLLSLFMSELVYESVEDNHPKIHCVLTRSSIVGVLVSLFAIVVSPSSWLAISPNMKFWFFHIIRCIVVSSYGVLCVPCLYKTVVLWNENKENYEVGLKFDGKLSDFDVNYGNMGKGD